MTKKWVSIILLVMCIVCAACFIVFPAAKTQGEVDATMHNAKYYSLTTCVVEIDRESNIVTVEDSTGNRWQFCGVEDWEIDDCASLLMWDNGTESILDDEIHGARYNAWTLTH